ncbi:MAG: hypothetical protein N3F09_06675 [Bacteroidia bacterium]|nr:hypothetical protein [Bacteroidia bacterium]
MKKLNKRHIFSLLLTLAGAAAGYFYYRSASCGSGGCIITSHPLVTVLYGALLGYLLTDFIIPKNKTKAL